MLEEMLDLWGEGALLVAAGMLVGLAFGTAAAHSRFCLRAATAEVATGRFGPRLAIWAIAFLAALGSVQAAVWSDVLDTGSARQIAATGSLSGAVIGGLMFGAGMILARGCASRLLILSASGNLRAIVTGLVLTLTAQAALRGVLAPPREAIAALWTIPGGAARQMIAPDTPQQGGLVLAALFALIAALVLGRRCGLRPLELASAACVGLAVAAGWLATSAIANASFDVIAIQSVTFTGPSADTLMALVNRPELPASFGLGLVPGVFLGAMAVALARGEARFQRFGNEVPMERYLLGGVLMGFGSMLAGGCAVGAGVSGGSILAVTAWVAVFCMWVGAMATELLLQAHPAGRATAN